MAGRADYKNKWQSENCDRINLVVKKGEKDRLKAHANGRGESLNAFIVRAFPPGGQAHCLCRGRPGRRC